MHVHAITTFAYTQKVKMQKNADRENGRKLLNQFHAFSTYVIN